MFGAFLHFTILFHMSHLICLSYCTESGGTGKESGESLKNYGTARQIFNFVADVVTDRFMNIFGFGYAVDVAKALVGAIGSEITVNDVTAANEAVFGHEFDKFEEKHTDLILTGITLDEFEKTVRQIASATSLPDTFVQKILLSKDAESNEVHQNEFDFNVGTVSNVWYCIATTAKVGADKIDFAIAFYNLKFKISDRVIQHRETKRLLGIELWTNSWTTHEPRKLNARDQNLFMKYMQVKAGQGFVRKYPKYRHLTSTESENPALN